jgi:hypothetical protein
MNTPACKALSGKNGRKEWKKSGLANSNGNEVSAGASKYV